MNKPLVSKLPDADMQAVPAALLRAGRRAREIARQTGTAMVVMRDGKLVEEKVSEVPQVDKGQETGKAA
jgi:adenine/guanine phosphoribosyltransferase-like PRPP-binding protein